MKENKITKTDLKKKSEELDIPFPNLLAGYILETILCEVAESDFSEYLWLKTNQTVPVGRDREEQYFRLDFVYVPGEKTSRIKKQVSERELSEEVIERMLSSIFIKDGFRGIRWKYRYICTKEELSVEATAEFEEMKVPLELGVRVLKVGGIAPEEIEFEPLFMGGRKVTYRHYPMEAILVEQLIQIVQYMELIPDMKSYYMVYQILSKEMIDGRRLQEAVTGICRNRKIECSIERGEMLSDYQEYSYMKKRWEKFSRGLKKEGAFQNADIPEWKDLSKKVFRFFLPIWNASARDEIFFGDWMPELGRYLD